MTLLDKSLQLTDVQKAFSAGSASAQAAFQSSVSGGGNILISQCAVGAGDQSARFRDEVLLSAESGAVLILPAGQINLSGITEKIDVSGLRLACRDGVASLDCVAPAYIDLFNLTGGDVDLLNIEFRRWKRPIYSSATLGLFRMMRCRLRQNRDPVYLLDRADNPNSYAERIEVASCEVFDSPGWAFKCASDSVRIHKNSLMRVRRDPAVWDYLTAHQLYGICIGDHDDAPPEYAQSITRRAVVAGNIVRGVSNISTNAQTTNAIVVAATEVAITGNVITDVDSPTNPYDCEGIYLKAAYGDVSGNILTDATRESCAIAVKGKSYGAPLAKQLTLHHNQVYCKSQVNAIGLTVFGSSVDVTVEDNVFDGCADSAVQVYGSPTRTYVRRNRANDCGGVPFYWACGDITDCENSENKITNQRVPSASDRVRRFNPYPDSGAYQMAGHQIKAAAGKIKAFTVTNGGSGYTVNGLPSGSCFVEISGGSGGSGGSGYATFANGVLVSVVPAEEGSGWVVAPTVTVPIVGLNGVTVSCIGSQASITTTLSTGKIDTLKASANSIRGAMAYSPSNPDANGYECLHISNGDPTSGPIIVDGIDSVDNGTWNASNPYYIVGLSLIGNSVSVGRASGIRMLGNNGGLRQQPWRASGTASLHRFSTYGTRFLLSPAEIEAGVVFPQTAFSVFGNRARLFINFSRFTASGSTLLGSIVGGQAAGAARIVKVTPRFVGPALTAASGAPTVAIGTAAGSGNLINATAAASLASASSPVDGSPANEVASSGVELGLYVTIAGGLSHPRPRQYCALTSSGR